MVLPCATNGSRVSLSSLHITRQQLECIECDVGANAFTQHLPLPSQAVLVKAGASLAASGTFDATNAQDKDTLTLRVLEGEALVSRSSGADPYQNGVRQIGGLRVPMVGKLR